MMPGRLAVKARGTEVSIKFSPTVGWNLFHEDGTFNGIETSLVTPLI